MLLKIFGIYNTAYKSDMYHTCCVKEELPSPTSLFCAVSSKCHMGEQHFSCLGHFKVFLCFFFLKLGNIRSIYDYITYM